MAAEFENIFGRLRVILQRHSPALGVREDSPACYSLDAPIGPATIQAWRGKKKTDRIPVAWVQIEKSYVSFHVMGLYGNSKLSDTLSPALKARMQGKTCFNFRKIDEPLFQELEQVTELGISLLRRAGFIT